LRASRSTFATLTAGLLLTGSLASLTAPAADAATERAGGRSYHTVAKIKKVKLQACIGPVRQTGAGLGIPVYVRLNNKRNNSSVAAKVTTNVWSSDYYARAHRSDSDLHAVITPDENVRFDLYVHKRTAHYEIIGTSIGAC
jgi:hypothetical protein